MGTAEIEASYLKEGDLIKYNKKVYAVSEITGFGFFTNRIYFILAYANGDQMMFREKSFKLNEKVKKII